LAQCSKFQGHWRRHRIFFGWWIAWAGCGLYFLNALAFTYGYSLFVEPWSQEFGWSRSAISAVWSATLGVGMLSALPAGWAIDRWGPRVVALISVPLVALGWFGVTLIQDYWSFFVVFAGLIGPALQPALVMAGQAAVNNWFGRDRSLAFALLSQGAGLAGLMGVPILGWCLAMGEWRLAARLLASMILIVGIALSLLFRPRPKPHGALSGKGDTAQRRTSLPEHSYSPAEARATLVFWQLILVYLSRFVGMGVVTLHLVPYLQKQGFSPPIASFALGLGLAASLPGRVFSGWAADRFATRWVLAFCLMLQAFSLVPIMLASGQDSLYLYAVFWGLGLGSENLIHSIRAEYFGQQYFGIISGYFTWPQMLGRMSGAVLGGIALDLLGSYLGAFLVAASLFGLAAIVALAAYAPVRPRLRDPAFEQ
jgi:MFS family permease